MTGEVKAWKVRSADWDADGNARYTLDGEKTISKPDVRMIEASHALLYALTDCVMVMERELSGLNVIQPELRNARAAIAKALGTK